MTNDNFNKKCMAEALVILMKEKDFNDISITEITNKAGVSRMFFYRNYKFKEDILTNYMYSLLEEYNSLRNNHVDNMYSRFLFAFNFFKQNKDFVVSMEKCNLSVIIQNVINDYMKMFYQKTSSSEDIYNVYFLSGALYNASKIWILSGLKESPEDMAKFFVNRMF